MANKDVYITYCEELSQVAMGVRYGTYSVRFSLRLFLGIPQRNRQSKASV